MLDNPIILIFAICLLVALFLFNKKKQKQDGGETANKKTNNKKNKKNKKTPAEVVDDPTESPKAEEAEVVLSLDDETSVASTARVSIEHVDDLTEYQVFKQFGYYDKAASALANYLETQTEHPPKLVFELCGLYLESGDVENFTENLDLYKSAFSKEEIEEVVKLGFEIDKDNLRLRVFAEEYLGWTIHQIDNLIGENLPLMDIDTQHDSEANPNNALDNGISFDNDPTEFFTCNLVSGYARINNIEAEERNSIEGLVSQERAAKLLYGKLEYTNAIRLLNTALGVAKRPANLALTALVLDHKNGDVDNYAKHLWWLFKSLGNQGRSVKGRMLSLGYSLGNHSIFNELETPKNELELKEMGINQGYADNQTTENAIANPLPLIIHANTEETSTNTEEVSNNAFENTNVVNIMQEVESQLSYGQVIEAIDTLEQAVLQHPQEVALYVTLYDLYERSENWPRYISFSRVIKTELEDIPEEIIIHMDRLNQKLQ